MAHGKHILVIEDDAGIKRGVVDALEFAGYRTSSADDGRTGLDLAITTDWDLLLLDLMLPKIDGFEILRQVRALRPTSPIIILTARGEEDDRVRGLRLGGDDYVVKPFGVRELLARVEAVLRRTPARPTELREVPIPGGVVDLHRREVRFDGGRRGELSESEAELLHYLASNPGRAVSRDELLTRLWRVEPGGIRTRAIDMHIARLREKLGDTGAAPAVILTVRGKGYMFAGRGEA